MIITLTACASCASGAEAPRAEETAEPASGDEAGDQAGSGDDSASAELVPPIPPDSVVAQLLMQRALEHPDVRRYLHLEIPDNLPLRVHAVSSLAAGAEGLTAGGQPVRVVPEAEARVRFTAREDLAGPRQRVRIEIPDEGVVGHVDLELADHVWSAVDAEITER